MNTSFAYQLFAPGGNQVRRTSILRAPFPPSSRFPQRILDQLGGEELISGDKRVHHAASKLAVTSPSWMMFNAWLNGRV
jgi:hypothetical protein